MIKPHNKFTVLYTAQINPKHSLACGWSVHRIDSREGAPTVVGNYMTETEAKATCNELNRVSEIQGQLPAPTVALHSAGRRKRQRHRECPGGCVQGVRRLD